MFEAVEVGRSLDKAAYTEQKTEIHTRLLALQRELTAANIPLLIIVSGVDGAGKSEVVRRLNTWFDARGVETEAFWDVTDEERQRPYHWRFWRRMPPRGRIAILFGSWYAQPIADLANDRCPEADFDRSMARVARLEQMLSADGMLIIKLWFHLGAEEHRKRVKKQRKREEANALLDLQESYVARYPRATAAAERAIRLTDTGECPWHLIEATDHRYRDVTTGQILVSAIEARLHQHAVRPAKPHEDLTPPVVAGADTTVLDHIDLTQALDRQEYDKRLEAAQHDISQLAWRMREQRRHLVVVFEGWDAAGKGGAIRRLIKRVDPRLCRVISVAAPTDEEQAHHYLWRFWRHIPAAGRLTIYDRSWYGRVLVERVDRLASPTEWQRAYAEINDFEEQLDEHGVVLCKFFIHISEEEQLRRFRERERTPWKKHKISADDWHNREKWPEYEHAINELVARTSTQYAPWHLVAGNDKRFARVQVVETVRETMREELA